MKYRIIETISNFINYKKKSYIRYRELELSKTVSALSKMGAELGGAPLTK